MANKIYVNARYAFRVDSLENWTKDNPILEKGEPSIVDDVADDEWLKIGDGITPWKELPYKKGPNGDVGPKGDKGDAGTDGINGKDGTSVTVSSVTESAEDGGSNIVTFSDGNRVTVKNGSKGDKGEAGASGVYVGSGEMPDGYNIQIDPNGKTSDFTIGGGGTWEKIVDITTSEEVNGIIATTEEFSDIEKCKEFIVRVVLPKTDTVLTLGAVRFFINDAVVFRSNTNATITSGLAEIRFHTIIANTFVHTVGTESSRGQANVVGNAMILVGNNFVTTPQKISIELNDTTKLLPIGTQFIIYGKVEG